MGWNTVLGLLLSAGLSDAMLEDDPTMSIVIHLLVGSGTALGILLLVAALLEDEGRLSTEDFLWRRKMITASFGALFCVMAAQIWGHHVWPLAVVYAITGLVCLYQACQEGLKKRRSVYKSIKRFHYGYEVDLEDWTFFVTRKGHIIRPWFFVGTHTSNASDVPPALTIVLGPVLLKFAIDPKNSHVS